MARKGTKGSPSNLTPPPPKGSAAKGSGTKGTPETLVSSTNLTKKSPQDQVPLNFRVPAEFRRDMKLEAAEKDISQLELLYRMRAFWKEHHR